jgi:Outer membrane efflux protein
MHFDMRMRFSLLLMLMAVLLIPTGCTRRFYREQADKQAEEVLTEKDRDGWKIENWHAYPDSLARFGDPANPDRPPMPFDDPGARDLSPNPQRPGNAGYGDSEGTGYLDLIRTWDAINRQDADANLKPAPMSSALPPAMQTGGDQAQVLRSDVQPYRLTFDQACELALLNSREFQDRREDLYLTALAVTAQRFSFAAQFFATETFFREYAGRRTVDPGNRWGMASDVSMSKLFPTGALLLARFANTLVYEMSGNAPKRLSVPSTASLDLTQPLLRGGGRAVTLEPLTQTERDLLYNVRAYARFRKLFHVAIAAGGDLFATISDGGFVLQRLGLSGNANTPGYLPTLLAAALVTNEQNNVGELERIITFYHQLQGGGDVSPLQTAQVESQLLNSRSTLLQREQALRESLDRFKFQIGVPNDLPLELDEGPVRPLSRQLQKLRDVYEKDRALQLEAKPLANADPADVREEFRKRLWSLALVQGTAFKEAAPARWAPLEKLSDDELAARIQQVAADRRALVDRQLVLESEGKLFPPGDQQRLDDLTFELDLALFEQALRAYVSRPWERIFPELPDPERQERQRSFRQEVFRRLYDLFVRLLGTARDQRLEKIRTSWPEVPRACVNGVDLLTADLDQALAAVAQTALTNRLDLMNARAQLVDSWRQIAVQANSLFGVVNVQYHLDTANDPLSGNPFGFQGGRTRQLLSLNTELPLTRRLERNEYRTALVAYQRRRRILQASEDQVLFEARNELRALRVLSANYKIQQRAVPVAYSQRDNALETLRVPNPPGQSSSAGNAAALTQQLLGAQSTVLQNENLLYQFFINYYVTRLQLYRDLELMPLDPRGVWIDEHTTRDCDVCLPAIGAARADEAERLPEPRAVGGAAPPETKKQD